MSGTASKIGVNLLNIFLGLCIVTASVILALANRYEPMHSERGYNLVLDKWTGEVTNARTGTSWIDGKKYVRE